MTIKMNVFFEVDRIPPIENLANMIGLSVFVKGEDGQMREMTRPQFEAYEMRVEAVLASVEQTLDAADRADFNEVAAAAREVVDIRREYLELSERQAGIGAIEPSREDREVRTRGRDESYHLQHTDISDVERDAIRADYLAESRRYDTVVKSYAKEALDGNTYLYERSKREENQQEALKEEAQDRASRQAIDISDPSRNLPARQHDEQVVRTGDELFERIDAARTEVHRERRDGRSTRSSDPAETQAEHDRRIAKLGEAEARHADLLREAAQAALDGNGYIRDMATIRQDLNNEIHIESRRREEAVQGSDENAAGASGPSEHADRAARLNEESRADPPQQHVPRLRQIEMELEERQDRHRDDRERH